MTSPARIKANRENGKKSRGPITAGGKSMSARNAVRHGLLAKIQSLPAADQQEFRELLEGLELAGVPINVQEQLLVEEIALGSWTKRRVLRIESEYFESSSCPETRAGPPATLADMFTRVNSMIDKTSRYASAADRRANRAFDRLVALRTARATEDAESSDTLSPIDDGIEDACQDPGPDVAVAPAPAAHGVTETISVTDGAVVAMEPTAAD